MNQNKITPFGYFLLITFFILLSYAGWIFTNSIDWNVLKRMEEAPLTLPTPASLATPSATTTE